VVVQLSQLKIIKHIKIIMSITSHQKTLSQLFTNLFIFCSSSSKAFDKTLSLAFQSIASSFLFNI
jgi:hypothetical protein